ncbi:MAG: hypothetical protein BWY42_01288 [Candidatus Omnitrophica bacterium ADurb.Bin277]|nr:MAG: hypothetical protein BWY42_01288 [Candidatus Omnitrophica bacterium ADurb.Bin277]
MEHSRKESTFNKTNCRKYVIFSLALFFVPSLLWGALITDVGPDGVLTLEDGKQVSLAGIELDRSGVSVLRVLVIRRDAKVEILQAARDHKGREYAYVSLKAKFLDFPFGPGGVAAEEDVLINRFLVALGAARVDDAQIFSKKEEFLEVQEQAKRSGEGIWSYERS